MLSRIVELTEEAQLSKPKLQRWLDKFGEVYSKGVMIVSVAVAFLGPFIFKWPFFSTSGIRSSLSNYDSTLFSVFLVLLDQIFAFT